jgi:H+-transporting ATPase
MVELKGLGAEEARARLEKFGANTLPEEKSRPWVNFLSKFWAPVPWMLEVIIVLELALGKYAEAWIIALLVLFNAVLSFYQEGKAKNALRLLRNRLSVQARVLRDGKWNVIAAEGLVPDDAICIRTGDIVPADAKLLEGHALIDQSALTGESMPVEPPVGGTVYAGSIVKHGEAYGTVLSTGKNTYYGKTAEIMRSAKTPSHLQRTIFSIVKYLVAFDFVLVLCLLIYSLYYGISLAEIVPFSLLLFVASVPVALPAMYALSTALGSMELARKGILVSKLSAIEEAAAMNVLCVDKTGTITQNSLKVSALCSYAPISDEDLLCLAMMACEEATQDPLDVAILKAGAGCKSKFLSAKKVGFEPFDPERKCSEAKVLYEGREIHVLKGAPLELLKMSGGDVSKDMERLGADGSRILAIIYGEDKQLKLAGLIALQDPPRETSKEAIREIGELGVKVVMITGDDVRVAESIAGKVGIEHGNIIARVFPEDKFHIIQSFQKEGSICGMTGDGVNDAPALKAAEVGIAVSNATDVAKASASLVLTKPGLDDILEAIKSSRCIYQRMLTYTLNKIIKTLQIAVLLGIGLIITGEFIISQLLIVLFLFANDFMTMSISTDRVSYSQKPDKWDIKSLVVTGIFFAALILVLSFFILYAGKNYFHLSILEIRTLIFLMLVFTGQATIYLVRERKAFWHSAPSFWMILASIVDIAIVSILAIYGVFMAPIHASLVVGLIGVVIIYFVLLDFIKCKIFSRILT